MLFEDSYKTIEAAAAGIYKDRGSRFLGMAYPVKSESEIKVIIQNLRTEHPKANHHCYAFRLGPGKSAFRFSDDREPAGTAGKPIYGVIQSNELTDILIVVVRYFGGTMLGVPGLINAYRSAAGDAINNCQIITRMVMERYRLKFKYDSLSLVMELIKLAKATILFQQLELDCTIAVELPKKAADAFILKIRNHYLLSNNCEITVL
jgi:uncharacterized YigZ family protein